MVREVEAVSRRIIRLANDTTLVLSTTMVNYSNYSMSTKMAMLAGVTLGVVSLYEAIGKVSA